MKRLAYLLCTAFLLLLTANVWAAPITVPSGLNPGDHYRLAFVTSTSTDATSSNIADYNAFVSAAAAAVPELAALGTTWKAIGSTLAVDARDNTGTNPLLAPGVPIYRLDGMRVAANNAGIWGDSLSTPRLESTISLTEVGSPVANNIVWTGTLPDGTKATHDPWEPEVQYDATLGSPSPMGGIVGFYTISQWVWGILPTQDFQPGMYAVSGELTVVPEPSTFVLATLGAMGLFVLPKRRRAACAALFLTTLTLFTAGARAVAMRL